MNQPQLFGLEDTYIKASASYRIPSYRVQLVRESTLTCDCQPEAITSPQAVADVVMEHLRYQDREHFIILLLDTKNRIIGINTVSIGTLNASIVHPREVFKPALIMGANSIILIHNHPSGDPSPSSEDMDVTKRLVEAGNILGIAVRDHIIIGDGCFYSFKDKGLL